MTDPSTALATRELFERLTELGYGDLLDAIEYGEVTTRGHRLNKCAIGRKYGLKAKDVEELLLRLRCDVENLIQ